MPRTGHYLASLALAVAASLGGAQPEPSSRQIGSWTQGSVSAVAFYYPTTGAWAPPSGSGFRYLFHSDGTYLYSGLMQTGLYGCATSLFNYAEGDYYIEGEVLMLIPRLDRLKSEDTCTERYNYERDLPLSTSYYYWQTGQDDYGGSVLELTTLELGADGLLHFDANDRKPARFFREEWGSSRTGLP